MRIHRHVFDDETGPPDLGPSGESFQIEQYFETGRDAPHIILRSRNEGDFEMIELVFNEQWVRMLQANCDVFLERLESVRPRNMSPQPATRYPTDIAPNQQPYLNSSVEQYIRDPRLQHVVVGPSGIQTVQSGSSGGATNDESFWTGGTTIASSSGETNGS